MLVHALLAAVPLDASREAVVDLADVHARVLGAPDDERDAAASLVEQALTHEVLSPRAPPLQAAAPAGGKRRFRSFATAC